MSQLLNDLIYTGSMILRHPLKINTSRFASSIAFCSYYFILLSQKKISWRNLFKRHIDRSLWYPVKRKSPKSITKTFCKIAILQKFIIRIVGKHPSLLGDRNSVNITSLKIKKKLYIILK